MTKEGVSATRYGTDIVVKYGVDYGEPKDEEIDPQYPFPSSATRSLRSETRSGPINAAFPFLFSFIGPVRLSYLSLTSDRRSPSFFPSIRLRR